MNRLNEAQLQKLKTHVDGWVANFEITKTSIPNQEVAFTENHLLPWLRNHVKNLNVPSLYVRGDGGPAIPGSRWHGFDFYPDLAIMQDVEKHVAFEVKLIRPDGSSAPITKAIGQTFMYSRLGFTFCYGLVFDLRRENEFLTRHEVLVESNNTSVHVFA